MTQANISTQPALDENPMHRMEVEGFDLHFDSEQSSSKRLVWVGHFADTGWDLAVHCERNGMWWALIEYAFRGQREFLTLGWSGASPAEAVRSAVIQAAAHARRSLVFLSALDPSAWREEEPEYGEAIEVAVSAFRSSLGEGTVEAA